MFGGSNTSPIFPVVLEENQFPYDSSATTQLQLFGNVPAACNADPTSYIGNNNISTLKRPNKRSREIEDIGKQYKLQISFNNFFQDEVDRSASIPNLNAVPTGLRLSYDEDEHNSSITSASGSMPTLPIIMSLGDNLRAEIDRQKEEFDRYIRIQEELLTKGVKEMKQRHMASFLSAVEKGVGRKLQEKELEIGSMNRKNRDLVEQIKQATMEAESWQSRARYNESVISVLKSNLQQAIAQGADQGKEGCGDSEVDDAASSYSPNLVLGGARQTGNKGLSSEQMACKSCKSKEISMLLIPCRHLCLCEDCVGFIDVCPVCHLLKASSVQVYMS